MPKRNRAFLFLVMPIAIFLWIFGWALYFLGSRKQTPQPWTKNIQENLEINVLIPEQQYAE
jgi:hypothetical protein